MVDTNGKQTAKSATVDELVNLLVDEIFEENPTFLCSVAERCTRLAEILDDNEASLSACDVFGVASGFIAVDFIAQGITQYLRA